MGIRIWKEASPKQKRARRVNWAIARNKSSGATAREVFLLTGDLDLRARWRALIAATDRKLRKAYL